MFKRFQTFFCTFYDRDVCQILPKERTSPAQKLLFLFSNPAALRLSCRKPTPRTPLSSRVKLRSLRCCGSRSSGEAKPSISNRIVKRTAQEHIATQNNRTG